MFIHKGYEALEEHRKQVRQYENHCEFCISEMDKLQIFMDKIMKMCIKNQEIGETTVDFAIRVIDELIDESHRNEITISNYKIELGKLIEYARKYLGYFLEDQRNLRGSIIDYVIEALDIFGAKVKEIEEKDPEEYANKKLIKLQIRLQDLSTKLGIALDSKEIPSEILCELSEKIRNIAEISSEIIKEFNLGAEDIC